MTEPMVRWFETLPSTQDEAHRLAVEGVSHGTAVAARVQTAGRGTRGRDWVSPEGGLWMSVVCRPLYGTAIEVVGLRVGLALADQLDTLVRPPARIGLKWPNDLLLGRGKVGGVLSEARWQGEALAWLVVGIGINLRNDVPANSVPEVTRLLEAGVTTLAEDLAEPMAATVAAAAAVASPLTQLEMEIFHSRDWLRGRSLALPEEGVAEGITTGGRLRVRRSDGQVSEVLGTVRLAALGA